MASIIGTAPNQVPTNGDLGTAAYVDHERFYSSANNVSFRNKIINGDMRIDQRNAGASVTAGQLEYQIDRWRYLATQASKITVQQSTTAPAGFKNSMFVTSSSAYTVSSTDYFLYQQFIEGLNCYDLAWGTASAKPVTLSFWVRSSLTGTFGGTFSNSPRDRCYAFTYTISSANTWEYKTISIAGDTTGTWATDTGRGIAVEFSLGAGSNYLGTNDAWSSSDLRGATGETKVVSTNGATFYITGVQLEEGSVATPFEHRPYGTELALCQRYFYKLDIAGGTVYRSFMLRPDGVRVIRIPFPQTMRASGTATYTYQDDGSGATLGSPYISVDRYEIPTSATTGANRDPRFTAFSISAEL